VASGRAASLPAAGARLRVNRLCSRQQSDIHVAATAYLLVALCLTSALLSVIFWIAWRSLGRHRHALTWSMTFAVATLQWIVNLSREGFADPDRGASRIATAASSATCETGDTSPARNRCEDAVLSFSPFSAAEAASVVATKGLSPVRTAGVKSGRLAVEPRAAWLSISLRRAEQQRSEAMTRRATRFLVGSATLSVVVLFLAIAGLLAFRQEAALAQPPGAPPQSQSKPLPRKKTMAAVDPQKAMEGPCTGRGRGALCQSECKGTEGLALSTCDGAACELFVTVPCGPYQCRDGSCLLSCSSDGDCAASHVCRSGACLLRPGYCSDDANTLAPGSGRYVVTSDRRAINCLPYRCVDGMCPNGCTSTADCYGGHVCDASGHCVVPSG